MEKKTQNPALISWSGSRTRFSLPQLVSPSKLCLFFCTYLNFCLYLIKKNKRWCFCFTWSGKVLFDFFFCTFAWITFVALDSFTIVVIATQQFPVTWQLLSSTHTYTQVWKWSGAAPQSHVHLHTALHSAHTGAWARCTRRHAGVTIKYACEAVTQHLDSADCVFVCVCVALGFLVGAECVCTDRSHRGTALQCHSAESVILMLSLGLICS